MKRKVLICLIIHIIIFSQCAISFAGDFPWLGGEVEGNMPVIVPPTPPDDTSTPPTTPAEPAEPTEPAESVFSITVPTTLTGSVWEDFERKEEIRNGDGNGFTTTYITNNLKKDEDEPFVSGINVLNGGEYMMTTGGDGKYSVSGAGSYNISFQFGIYPGNSTSFGNNYSTNKNILKYNGQDYSMLMSGSGAEAADISYIRKIKEMKESYTEVFILIDFSATMRTVDDVLGGKRIDVVRESATEFINQLFEEAGGNVSVGFIAFAYEAVILKKPTTLKDDVIDAIRNFDVQEGKGVYDGKYTPNFTSLNHRVGTNIGGAVDKARANYLSEESNKVMVLFSDGGATAHDQVESLYANDSDSQIAAKLDRVAEYTKVDLQEVIENEITLITVLNDTYSYTNEAADETIGCSSCSHKPANERCGGTEYKYAVKNFGYGAKDQGRRVCLNNLNEYPEIGSQYVVDYSKKEIVQEALLNHVKQEIEETDTELIQYEDIKTYSGHDDQSRRNVLNEYYNSFYYDKLGILDVVDDLQGTEEDVTIVAKYMNETSLIEQGIRAEQAYREFLNSEEVKEFVENSWMQTTPSGSISLYQVTRSGDTITVTGPGTNLVIAPQLVDTQPEADGEDDDDDPTNDSEHMEEKYFANGEGPFDRVEVNEISINLDGILIRRDECKLELEQKITGVRLTLSDGTVLYNKVSDNAGETALQNEIFKELYCKQLQNVENIDMQVRSLEISEVKEYIPDSVTLVVDTSLLQGATLEIEYTMIVKNNSGNGTFSKEISIVDYFDSNMVYRDDVELISEEGTNSDYGWQMLKSKELYEDRKIISPDANSHPEMYCLYVNYTQEGYRQAEGIPSNGNTTNYETYSKYMNPVIGNNGERYAKVVLSRVLSAELLDEFVNNNQAEIVKYSNNNYRRMNYSEINETTEELEFFYPIAGNYVPHSIGAVEIQNNSDEIDTAIANPVTLIPPTGGNSVKLDRKNVIFGMLILIAMIPIIVTKTKVKKMHYKIRK